MMCRLFYIILIGYETQNGFGKDMATLFSQVLTNKARCSVNLAIWLIITAILASKQTMIMLESRMPGQLACPVWRGLGRNASQQWDDRAPVWCKNFIQIKLARKVKLKPAQLVICDKLMLQSNWESVYLWLGLFSRSFSQPSST